MHLLSSAAIARVAVETRDSIGPIEVGDTDRGEGTRFGVDTGHFPKSLREFQSLSLISRRAGSPRAIACHHHPPKIENELRLPRKAPQFEKNRI